MISSFFRWLGQGIEALPKWISLGAGYLLMGVALLTTWSVFMRYGLRKPYGWTYELGGFVFLAVCAAGVGYALQTRRHIGVDILISQLPPKSRQIAGLFSLIVTTCWGTLVLWGTGNRALFNFRTGNTSQILEVPLFPFEVLAPLGMVLFLLVGLTMVRKDLRELRGKRPPVEDGHPEKRKERPL